jgi:hypothetical protein
LDQLQHELVSDDASGVEQALCFSTPCHEFLHTLIKNVATTKSDGEMDIFENAAGVLERWLTFTTPPLCWLHGILKHDQKRLNIATSRCQCKFGHMPFHPASASH